MNLDEAFVATRAAFPEPTPPGRMLELLTVVLGDAARLLRAHGEGQPLDRPELARELANLALTALRLIDDLGIDVTARSLQQRHHTPGTPSGYGSPRERPTVARRTYKPPPST